jgi:hypothetical protein
LAYDRIVVVERDPEGAAKQEIDVLPLEIVHGPGDLSAHIGGYPGPGSAQAPPAVATKVRQRSHVFRPDRTGRERVERRRKRDLGIRRL